MKKKIVQIAAVCGKISKTILCALLLAIFVGSTFAYSIQALSDSNPGYTIIKYQIVKLVDTEPVPTSSFLLTDEAVYIHFEINWRSVDDCKRTLFTQKLYDPDSNVSEKSLSFYTEILGQGYAMGNGNLLLFNITNTTKLGTWRVEWYDADTLLLIQEAGMSIIPEFPNTFIFAIFLTAVTSVAMFMRRRTRRNPFGKSKLSVSDEK